MDVDPIKQAVWRVLKAVMSAYQEGYQAGEYAQAHPEVKAEPPCPYAWGTKPYHDWMAGYADSVKELDDGQKA